MKQVQIYTDGACKGNPGPGGYGVILLSGDHRKELSGGFRLTTNNRMEITAAIKGLEALKKPCQVELFTDSKYLSEAMTQNWAIRWKSNNWMRNKGDRASNADLWSMMLELCDTHNVTFTWVKGHASNDLNNRCDELAVEAAAKTDLPTDHCYEVFYASSLF